MAWRTGAALLSLVIFCVSSAQDTDTLVVLYPKRTISAASGTSVKLHCDVEYDLKLCGLVQVVWCQSSSDCAELTDPGRYFTTVNETASQDGHTRRRQVVTEIVHLTRRDSGTFQCNAACENEETARGHFITITVED